VKLTGVQLKELKEKLEAANISTTKGVRLLIRKIFDLTYSSRQISRILRKLGMTLQKPYPHDYRRPKNSETLLQNQLALTFELLKKMGLKQADIGIGFFDEASPQTTSNTARVWSFKKKPSIEKNTSRLKLNAAGFYAIKGNSTIAYLKNSTQDEIMEMFKKIKDANSGLKAIIVVLDNFRSHKTVTVLSRVRELGIYPVFLPPYSPHLNPIEFIWKSVKRVISLSFIKNEHTFQMIAKDAFDQCSRRLSFARSWISDFFNPLWNEYLNYEKFCH